MKIDIEKIIVLAKDNGLNISLLCKTCKVSTSTFWRWRNGITQPKNKDVINIAKVLNVNSNELIETPGIKEKSLSENFPSLNNISDYLKQYNEKFKRTMQELKYLNTSAENVIILMSGILENTNIAFYVKNTKLKYIIANTAFLNHLKLKKTYNVFGKTDSDLLPLKEAQKNEKEDEIVFISKKPILGKEQYIPGTSRKKWGFVSKMPIFNNAGKELGIIAVIVDITEKVKQDVINRLLKIALGQIDYNVFLKELNTNNYLFFSDQYNKKIDTPPISYIKDSIKERIDKNVFISDREPFYKKLNDFYYKKTDEFNAVFREYVDLGKSEDVRWISQYMKKISFLEKKYYIKISKDITSDMEEKIRLMLESHIINNLEHTCVFCVKLPSSQDGKIKLLSVSSQAESITGYKPEYFLKNEDSILNLLDGENRSVLEKSFYLGEEFSSEYGFVINHRGNRKKKCKFDINYFWLNDVLYGSIILSDISRENKLRIEADLKLKNEIKAIALKLKNNNIEVRIIAQSTGLSVKEIEKL